MISITQKLNKRQLPNRKLNELGTCIFYARSLRESERFKYRRVMEAENRGLDLERELTCTICTEILYAPQTLLDCLHTFCGSCLKKWFSRQYSSWQNVPESLPSAEKLFTCPACRAPVRDTKHNSTVTTLLEMFLTANPDKCRRPEELEELKKFYCHGDCVLPRIVKREREILLRERRAVDSDRRLVNEAREISLREALTETSNPRRDRVRRDNEDSRRLSPLRTRNNTLETGSFDEQVRVRRRRREERQPRRNREEGSQTAETLRRRTRSGSDELAATRRENSVNHTVHQVNHQSSLRSLISQNDIDSSEMKEEILRQIRDEGLLDGIDLENIDVNQEDQISERIAEAFRRRQNERARQESGRRNAVSQTRSRNHSSPESSETLRQASSRASSRIPSCRIRISTGNGQNELPVPSQRPSTMQTARIRAESMDESRQRNRRTKRSNRCVIESIPGTNLPVKPTTKSASDLRDRSQSMMSPMTWTGISQSSRSSIDLTTVRPIEPLVTDIKPLRIRSSSNSQSSSTMRIENSFGTPEQNHRNPPNAETSVSPKQSANTPSKKVLVSPPPSSNQLLSERANALSNGPIINPSSNKTGWKRSSFYTEPLINCTRCGTDHIEYEWHYNCKICSGGNYNICLSCYRAGRGCQHWLGIGEIALKKWEALELNSGTSIEKPHVLIPSRYLPPKIIPGGADGRRTLTTEDPRKRLQSGTFCANCFAWTNECYWRCSICNDSDWGFCNNCVNQGYCCTHSILPLTYTLTGDNTLRSTPTHGNKRPVTAQILTGPGVVDSGPFKPLTFSTRCDICRYPIQSSQTRYHCYSCTSTNSNTHPGNYDVCINCYPKLVRSRHISIENGPNGWRRCLKGHRMVVIGFQDKHDGQHRHLVNDMVGGRSLHQKPYTTTTKSTTDQELQIWSWGDGIHVRGDNTHARLVTNNVQKSAPPSSSCYSLNSVDQLSFPPDGGVGMKAIAIWGWFPSNDDDNELLFPRGAEIRECKDVNGDWFHGTYMGKQGLFPSNHVRILNDKSSSFPSSLSESS